MVRYTYLLAIALGAAAAVLSSGSSAAASRTAALARCGIDAAEQAVADALEADLKASGYQVRTVDAAGLSSPEALRADAVDLLALPSAASLPAASAPVIDRFLKQGGDILALGAPLWQRAVIHVDGRWLTPEEFEIEGASKPLENQVFAFDEASLPGWTRTTNNPSSPTHIAAEKAGPGGVQALHVTIEKLTNWDTVVSPVLKATPFRNGDELTVIVARGGPRTNQLAVEWQENDQSRWIAVIPLTTDWRRYVIRPEQFKYWLSNPARASSRFNPKNANRLAIGLAYTHMGVMPGAQEYYVSSVGTAPVTDTYRQMISTASPPPLDILSPTYKFFSVTGPVDLRVRSQQVVCGQADIPGAEEVYSVHPRPMTGYNKRRDWRFIPILDAVAGDGQWRGHPAAMLVHSGGPYKGGVWASFAVADPGWYLTPEVRALVRQALSRMNEPNWIIDGGSNFYTYFSNQPVTIGSRVLTTGSEPGLEVRLSLRDPGSNRLLRQVSSRVRAGQESYSAEVAAPKWPSGELVASAELLRDGRLIDRLENSLYVWKPKAKKSFVTTRGGDFYLDGKRWRAHGVNYMPSSGIGTEDGEYFEHWIGARSYDPEIVERDLKHIKDLGLNSVSIFIYGGFAKDQNLLDLLRRLEDKGLKANVSLRPGTPLDFQWEQIRGIIEYYRLWEHDSVFALDLAWEPIFGKQQERSVHDAGWRQWIDDRYGSLANAERDWGYKAPLDSSGLVTGPGALEIDGDGPWRVMTAAYRRYLDTLLYARYGAARELVRQLDKNHLVSFRMAEAGNPNYRWEGRIPYDFPYLAAAVDMLAPEAYGRIGDWEKVKPGIFEFEYARWAAPEDPMIWAEMGVSSWHLSRMRTDPKALDFQGEYFSHFYRMLIQTGADGIFYWWYPGGFRFGENSDFGIINPDGTDRPSSRVIRNNAERYINGPLTREVTDWLEFDRDQHPDGIAGIYDKLSPAFYAALDAGKAPGLRTPGTGTTSMTCPNEAIGGTLLTGSNPHKYLDGYFDNVELKISGSGRKPVERGATVTLAAGSRVELVAEVTNLAEAAWASGRGRGAVDLVIIDAQTGRVLASKPLRQTLQRHATASISISLSLPSERVYDLVLTMRSAEVTTFGDRFCLRVDGR